jgi:FKBP-type peptidyl-prolyl cis-trans isomerase 2
MLKSIAGRCNCPVVEILEGRVLLSFSPALAGQHVVPTHTVLQVEAGTLGEPITFDVTVFAQSVPGPAVDLYFHGKVLQEIGLAATFPTNPHFPNLFGSEGVYTVPAGTAGAEMFGVGLHAVRAQFVGKPYFFKPSTVVAEFRVERPQFATQASGVGIATVVPGSGPAIRPGQTATAQYDAYLAATNRLFDSTESQTPDTFSFTVDANPEQVIPGLDAGVVGMQSGETRAIYIPRSLSRGVPGSSPTIQPRANLVYLVTLVSIS